MPERLFPQEVSVVATSAFDDKTKPPKESDLAAVLGPAARAWGELEQQIASRFAPLSREWVFSGAKYGWSLRLKRKQRAVLYMTPCARHFRVAFALGEKAAAAARAAGLPDALLAVIESAPKYAEGRAVRLEVRKLSDLKPVVTIAEIKMAN
jgi:hypothetical protein